MVKVWTGSRWRDSEKIPQEKGSKWKTERYIHGPRVRKPEDFQKIYLVSPDWAEKRRLKLIKKPSEITKVKVGTLKKTGELAVQSYLTHVHKSKPIVSKNKKIFSRDAHHRRVKTFSSFAIFTYSKNSGSWTQYKNYTYPNKGAAIIAKHKIFNNPESSFIKIQELKPQWR